MSTTLAQCDLGLFQDITSFLSLYARRVLTSELVTKFAKLGLHLRLLLRNIYRIARLIFIQRKRRYIFSYRLPLGRFYQQHALHFGQSYLGNCIAVTVELNLK